MKYQFEKSLGKTVLNMDVVNARRFARAVRAAMDGLELEARCYCLKDEDYYRDIMAYLGGMERRLTAKAPLKYVVVCRVRCSACGQVLEWRNRSKDDYGPGKMMVCKCGSVGLDPAATMYRIVALVPHADWEDLSIPWVEIWDEPANMMRKAAVLWDYIANLKQLQTYYGPIFINDPWVKEQIDSAEAEFAQMDEQYRVRLKDVVGPDNKTGEEMGVSLYHDAMGADQ